MKAMLLCAGYGTRLRPYTLTTPKCLMKIKNQPLLDIWLDQLSNNGVDTFLINGHYLSKTLKDFILSSKYSKKISFVYEKKLLGTAGTLMRNINFFNNKDGLLIHADNYCITDFKKFIVAHNKRPKKCLMTMMTFKPESTKSSGMLEIDDSNIMTDYEEKPSKTSLTIANGAVYILSGEFLKILKKKYSKVKDFSNEIIPEFKNYIYTYENKDILIDIGTKKNYIKANKL